MLTKIINIKIEVIYLKKYYIWMIVVIFLSNCFIGCIDNKPTDFSLVGTWVLKDDPEDGMIFQEDGFCYHYYWSVNVDTEGEWIKWYHNESNLTLKFNNYAFLIDLWEIKYYYYELYFSEDGNTLFLSRVGGYSEKIFERDEI